MCVWGGVIEKGDLQSGMEVLVIDFESCKVWLGC